MKNLKLPLASVYPVLLILIIPSLLIFNTYWNLKSFNRDANFIIRHQAVSIADTIKPLVEKSADTDSLEGLLDTLVKSNEDIISISLFRRVGDNFEPVTSTLGENASKNLADFQLNYLAVGFNEPFAALTYDPVLGRNIWNVIVPVAVKDSQELLNFQLDTKSVSEILGRTAKDSYIILAILIIVTLLLLANHFYFYIRSLKTKQLEELDRLKDEFLSMAAHELRAPITAITGYLEMLRDEIASGKSSSVTEDINVLTGLTHELNGLVEELLDVSRIEQGRIKVEPQEVNINEIVEKVLIVMNPTAVKKGINIKFAKEEIPVVKTDPERIRQVITNLVSNAVKYSLKGEVSIYVKPEDKFIKITVKDTGIGIPPDEINKLFTKFHRVQDAKTKEVRGTGLGLWITKQIVELLGGTIYVESIYGTGSSFSFTVPRS